MPIKTKANPEEVLTYAQKLVDSGKYNPTGTKDNPVTFCNQFLSAVAKEQWDCNEFENQSANEIVDFIRNSSDWTALHDYSKNLPDLATSMKVAQQKAEAGLLVVCGWRHEPNGHVSLVVKTKVQQSGNWGMEVCFSAQAGGFDKNGNPMVFANEMVSFGYRAEQAVSNDFVVYSRG